MNSNDKYIIENNDQCPAKAIALPNRKRISQKLGVNIPKWILKSPIIRINKKIDDSVFFSNVETLIETNDALITQLEYENGLICEKFIYEKGSYHETELLEDGLGKKAIYPFICEKIDYVCFQFDYRKPLFKCVLFHDKSFWINYVVFVVNHVIADRESMKLITNKFIDICSGRFMENSHNDNFSNYVLEYTNSRSRVSKASIAYWKDYPWDIVHETNTLLIEKMNFEAVDDSKTFATEDIAVILFEDSKDYEMDILYQNGYTLFEICIAAYAFSMSNVFATDFSYIDIVHHNRRNYENGRYYQNTIGWISTVYPTLIKGVALNDQSLEDASETLSNSIRYGNVFNDMYGYDDRLQAPLMSLNFVDTRIGNISTEYDNIGHIDQGFGKLNAHDNHLNRLYPICSGIILRENQLTISVNYNHRVISNDLMKGVSDKCAEAIRKYISSHETTDGIGDN